RHPRLAVDPNRATATLPLRAAAVLHRADTELLAERVEQCAVLGNADRGSVHAELNVVTHRLSLGALPNSSKPCRSPAASSAACCGQVVGSCTRYRAPASCNIVLSNDT